MTNPTKTDSPSRSVVTECVLPDAPEKVWKALTTPELLAGWLPHALDCEILAAEPNRLLRYRWPGNDQDKDASGRPLESVVTFELTDTSTGGTHLRVIHSAVASARVIPFKRGICKEPAAFSGTWTTTMLRRAA